MEGTFTDMCSPCGIFSLLLCMLDTKVLLLLLLSLVLVSVLVLLLLLVPAVLQVPGDQFTASCPGAWNQGGYTEMSSIVADH